MLENKGVLMSKIKIKNADGVEVEIDDNLDNEFLEKEVTPYTEEDDKEINESSKKLRDKLLRESK